MTLNLGHSKATELFGKLRQDVDYLMAENVMDYSLIIGISPLKTPVNQIQDQSPRTFSVKNDLNLTTNSMQTEPDVLEHPLLQAKKVDLLK